MYPPPLPRHHFPQSKNTKHVIVDSDDPPLRLYQVWKGRNKFFCGGRVIFGPDVKSIFVTLSLILVPLIFFWTFVSKGLIIVFPHGWGIAIIAFSGILAAQVVILLFLTSGSDPGIIPRNAQPPAPEPDDSDSTLSADWGASQSIAPSRPMTRNVTVNGVVVKVKYCQTCKLYRPPRCSHCSICNNCVERFDHHCPWVGQCIGKRNYRYFVLFVSTTSILCSYVLICCFVNIMRIADKYNCSAWDAVRRSPVSGILVVYTFVVCWFVGGLTTFHLYLIATNQTTYENFRYRYDRKMNPYNLGFSRNCQQVFCSKIPSSGNDFREKVNRDDSSYDFGFSTYPSQAMRIKMATRKFDIQMVNQAGLDADDFEDIRSNVGSLSRLERCSTEPRRNEWDRRSNWDVMSPDHV